MFAHSLLDVSRKERYHRGYATLVSFGLESLAVFALLVMPLLYVETLPHLRAAMMSLPVPPPAPSAPASTHHPTQAPGNFAADGSIIAPTVPEDPAPITDDSIPVPPDISQFGAPGGTGDPTARSGVLWGTGTGTINIVPPPPPPIVSSKPPRVSQLMDGYLVIRVQPSYPPLARQARIQGSVILHALISRDGRIENLQLVSGHPLLVQSAMDAVKQWRYRPYLLNNEPVEVETQITVNFSLGGG
ncbi:MAG TPA: energy transducer TonB [Terriglobales bacterium]